MSFKKLQSRIETAIYTMDERSLSGWISEATRNPRVAVSFATALAQTVMDSKATDRRLKPEVHSTAKIYEDKLTDEMSRVSANFIEKIAVEFDQQRTAGNDIGICQVLFGCRVTQPELAPIMLRQLNRLIVRHISHAEENSAAHQATGKMIQEWLWSFCATRTLEILSISHRDDDRKSLQTFVSILSCMGEIQIEPIATLNKVTLTSQNVFTLEEDRVIIRIPIREEFADVLQWCVATMREEAGFRQEKLVRLLNWAVFNREAFFTAWDSMWQDIQQRPRRGLRAGGYDHVKLNLSAFQETVTPYHSLRFHPEQCISPITNVRFSLTLGDEPLMTQVTLSPTSEFRALLADTATGINVIEALKLYMSLEAYWRIVTQEPKKSGHSGGGGGGTSTSVGPVRPHFRYLVGIQQPSEEALARSLETFKYLPPPQFTFVREHERGTSTANPEDVPAQFTYTEKDLGYTND